MALSKKDLKSISDLVATNILESESRTAAKILESESRTEAKILESESRTDDKIDSKLRGLKKEITSETLEGFRIMKEYIDKRLRENTEDLVMAMDKNHREVMELLGHYQNESSKKKRCDKVERRVAKLERLILKAA